MSEDSITRYEFNLLKESIEERLSKVDNSLLAIWGKIDKRLPWSVLVIVSFLSSLVVGLLVALLK